MRIVAVLAGAFLCSSVIASDPTPWRLTFEERVEVQGAIEQVYWKHRIWPESNKSPDRQIPPREPNPSKSVRTLRCTRSQWRNYALRGNQRRHIPRRAGWLPR
jgi:hypothetical protein